jgi:2-polyprenyl-3-methyl-5-hydroxy-6-metoxy-1,4-benzoquinol methylase
MSNTQQEVATHFDAVAEEYDYWKKKNWFYYDALRTIARSYVSNESNLLDVGCGTGAMIEATKPRRATGIDISPDMVEIAKARLKTHPEYTFLAADITKFKAAETYDAILFFDVIEHVPDTNAALASLYKLIAPNGRLVVTMANPLWEPILMVAEKLKLKMPEGPHYRVPTKEFLQRAGASGLKLTKREWYLLFPKFIPGFSWFINDVIGRIPIIQRLAVIEVFVFTKA